ncbi:hypothetical protein BG015_001734 [Linnemannia schmuckeri]|uniref:Uncharacterized protein n=1 Tax=Linnemannia schmuckeri TaxID=64567 RepID=A0A9P5S3S5_9FUNG|nr:hypothetical protein BG015_001734 [Linnemannia schmuckeri]
MSSTSSLLTLPSVDEPLELTKTAPILDPKIPFFKYLDMLTTISQNTLSLRQQAYEIFLALNPHFSYTSSSASGLNLRQHPVKVNKKIETLLKSSMILLQRYCLVIQVSLPKLPSFRRRTHGNSLKAYEVRAAGYLKDLKQYQEEGGLLYLQACFVRSKAAERDVIKSAEPSSQGQVNAGDGDSDGDGTSVVPSVDRQMVAKAPLAKSVPAAISTDKEVPKSFNNSATTAATAPPGVVVVVENPSKSKVQLSVPVVVAEKSHKTKDHLNVPIVAVIEKLPKTKEQPSVAAIVAKSTSPSRSLSRRSSHRKKPIPEAQVKGKVEVTSLPADNEATAPLDAIATETTKLPGLALTSAALWKLERDLERLQKVEATMKEQIAQSAHIRARVSESTAVPSTTITMPVHLTSAALTQLSTATPPTATSAPLRSYLPTSAMHSSTTVSQPSAAAPSIATSTPVHSTPATVNTCSSTFVIPASTTTMEQSKRSKVSTVVTPAVTLTAPTPPVGTPPKPPKPLTTRGTLPYSPPKEMAKSTNKRMSPATGAIKGSGVVRNLIRQYETPSSASSTSSQSDRSDLKLHRKKKSTTANAAEVTMATPAGVPGGVVKIAKTGQTTTNFSITTTTLTTAATTTTASGTATTVGAGVGTGLISRPRKDASPELGDKQNTALISASSLKTRPVQDTSTKNRDSIRADNNKNGFTHPIISPVVNTSTSSALYSLSKARSAIAKSALILGTHQTTHTQGPSRDQPSKPRTAAEAVKDSYLLGFQTKTDVEKQSPLQVPVQGYQSRTRPTLNGKNFWNNQPPPPPLGQTRKISSSLINTVTSTTSATTVFRGGAESKPVVALEGLIFPPSNPSLTRSAIAVVSEVNFGNRSSSISTSPKAMSSQESIDSWRRDVPAAASASRHPPADMQDWYISASMGSITGQPTVDWLNEADYEDNDEDDGQSHVELIRIPTMNSTRSSATATTTRTASFSASHPLGSDRFKAHYRTSRSSALVQEEKQKETQEFQKPKEDEKEDKKRTSGYVPDTDESDTDTANLQILEIPPTRGTQAWLEMRARELQQEREEEGRHRLEEDSGDDSGPENGYDESSQLEQQHRYDSKCSTMRIDETNSQRQTVSFSRPRLSQVRFDVHGLSQPSHQGQRERRERKQELDEISTKSSAPSFTRPFEPEYHPPIQLSTFNNAHQAVSQKGSRPTRQYASTISPTSTRSIRQPSLTHSVSPASSTFVSLRGTPVSSTMAPSIKSFATGSTTTLDPPKFYPPSPSFAAASRSYYPIQGQTVDGATDTLSLARVRNIRTREARVLGSPAVPILGSQPRQMNVQSAATLVMNESYYGQQQQPQQQNR